MRQEHDRAPIGNGRRIAASSTRRCTQQEMERPSAGPKRSATSEESTARDPDPARGFGNWQQQRTGPGTPRGWRGSAPNHGHELRRTTIHPRASRRGITTGTSTELGVPPENRRKITTQPPKKGTEERRHAGDDAAPQTDRHRLRGAARYAEARKRSDEPIRRNAIAKRNTKPHRGTEIQHDETPASRTTIVRRNRARRAARGEQSRRPDTARGTEATARTFRGGTIATTLHRHEGGRVPATEPLQRTLSEAADGTRAPAPRGEEAPQGARSSTADDAKLYEVEDVGQALRVLCKPGSQNIYVWTDTVLQKYTCG